MRTEEDGSIPINSRAIAQLLIMEGYCWRCIDYCLETWAPEDVAKPGALCAPPVPDAAAYDMDELSSVEEEIILLPPLFASSALRQRFAIANIENDFTLFMWDILTPDSPGGRNIE